MIPPPIEQTEREEVRKLARRLRRSDPVRQIAFALLTEGPEEICSAHPLINALMNLSEVRWRERAVAAWALGRVSLEESQKEEVVRLLCCVAANEQMGAGKRLLKRSVRAVLWTSLYGLLPFGVDQLLVHLSKFEDPDSLMPSPGFLYLLLTYWGLCLLALTFPFASLFLDYNRNLKVRKYSIRSLCRLGSPASIGTLAGLIKKPDMIVSAESETALKHLLPYLTPEHYPDYSDATPHLCRLLGGADWPFSLQVLEALEKIGDGRAVEVIERLTKRGLHWKVQEEAERILPLLQERQRKEKDPRRLVRAADIPEGLSTLLRPAAGNSPSEPQAFLRAVSLSETSEDN